MSDEESTISGETRQTVSDDVDTTNTNSEERDTENEEMKTQGSKEEADMLQSTDASMKTGGSHIEESMSSEATGTDVSMRTKGSHIDESMISASTETGTGDNMSVSLTSDAGSKVSLDESMKMQDKTDVLQSAHLRALDLHNELQDDQSSFDWSHYVITTNDQDSIISDNSDLVLTRNEHNYTLEETATHW